MNSWLGTFGENDRTMGLFLLGKFWAKSPLSSGGIYSVGASFDGMVNYYDGQEPGFISWLGSLVNQYGLDVMITSVEKAGKISGTSYPRKSAFADYAIRNFEAGSTTNVGFAIDAVTETASDVASALPAIGKTMLFISLAFFAYLGYQVYKGVK